MAQKDQFQLHENVPYETALGEGNVCQQPYIIPLCEFDDLSHGSAKIFIRKEKSLYIFEKF